MPTSTWLMRGRRGRNKGQTLLEFALAIPLVMLIAFGIIQFSVLMLTYSSLDNATQEATRYLTIHGRDLGPTPPFSNSAVCSMLRKAMGSSFGNAAYLGKITIFGIADGQTATASDDNANKHDVGICNSGAWTYVSRSTYGPYCRNDIEPTDRIGLTVNYNFHFIVHMFGTTLPLKDTIIQQVEPLYSPGQPAHTVPPGVHC